MRASSDFKFPRRHRRRRPLPVWLVRMFRAVTLSYHLVRLARLDHPDDQMIQNHVSWLVRDRPVQQASLYCGPSDSYPVNLLVSAKTRKSAETMIIIDT